MMAVAQWMTCLAVVLVSGCFTAAPGESKQPPPPAPVVATRPIDALPSEPGLDYPVPDGAVPLPVETRPPVPPPPPGQPPPPITTFDARVIHVYNMPSNMLEFLIIIPDDPAVTTKWTGRFLDAKRVEIAGSDFSLISKQSKTTGRCRVTNWMASLPSELVRLHGHGP